MTIVVLLFLAALAVSLGLEPLAAMPREISCYSLEARPPIPRWWLAEWHPERATLITWKSSEWPRVAVWQWVLAPLFRWAIGHGIWVVAECDYYVNGRLRPIRDWRLFR